MRCPSQIAYRFHDHPLQAECSTPGSAGRATGQELHPAFCRGPLTVRTYQQSLQP
jgi:hypothetical protein